MKWAPSRKAAPASSAQLHASAARMRDEVASLSAEAEEIPAALPALADEPSRFADAQARLREIQALLPVKEAALAAVESAIAPAETRERREGVQADVNDLRRRTAKLSRNLEARYTAAATALAGILAEMRANAEEWEQMNPTARAEGLSGGDHAEFGLRRDIQVPHGPIGMGGGFRSLTDVDVRGWRGELIFEGTPNRNRSI